LNQFGWGSQVFDQKRNPVRTQISQYLQQDLPSITVAAFNNLSIYEQLVPFISKIKAQTKHVPLIPEKFLGNDWTISLNIPPDVESPAGRLLRPQTMVIEYALRRFTSLSCFCMNLKQGRSPDFQAEKDRYLKVLRQAKPTLAITDSQAMDLFHPWTPPDVPITTFSVTMANIQTGGRLHEFARGIEKLAKIRPGDRVLICEACNHDRIGDDIGTVQLPTKLKKLYPFIDIDWAWGRSYENKNLKDYALTFHCGGCMISRQQMTARLQDLLESGVPVVNYGLALAWLAGSAALERVLKPWQ
jgi:hypothetical protein